MIRVYYELWAYGEELAYARQDENWFKNGVGYLPVDANAEFRVRIQMNDADKIIIRGVRLGPNRYRYSYVENTGGLPRAGAVQEGSYNDLSKYINNLADELSRRTGVKRASPEEAYEGHGGRRRKGTRTIRRRTTRRRTIRRRTTRRRK